MVELGSVHLGPKIFSLCSDKIQSCSSLPRKLNHYLFCHTTKQNVLERFVKLIFRHNLQIGIILRPYRRYPIHFKLGYCSFCRCNNLSIFYRSSYSFSRVYCCSPWWKNCNRWSSVFFFSSAQSKNLFGKPLLSVSLAGFEKRTGTSDTTEEILSII